MGDVEITDTHCAIQARGDRLLQLRAPNDPSELDPWLDALARVLEQEDTRTSSATSSASTMATSSDRKAPDWVPSHPSSQPSSPSSPSFSDDAPLIQGPVR